MVETRASAKRKRADGGEKGDSSTTKVKRRTQRKRQSSRLLALAPELRNRIYEYALLEPDHVDVTRHFRPPGLLATCRQIRSEACPMYFQQNTFSHTILDCNGSLFLNWSECFADFVSVEGVSCHFFGGTNWSNLINWVEATFKGKTVIGCFDIEANDPPWLRVIFTAHKIMCNGKRSGSTWDDVATQLEYLHQTVAAYDSAWE